MSGKLKIIPKPPKGEDGYETFSIRILTSTVQALNKISISSGRSRNELIGILLRFAIENCEIETFGVSNGII